jgi:putative PEP-CTERM system TPR-repeat lipoprotein
MKRIGTWLAMMAVAFTLSGCLGESVDSLMQRAAEEREQGLYQSAMADYRAVLEREPNNAEARLGLGEVSLRLGDPANAEEQLRRAAELGVEPARVQPPLAEALLQQNKPGEVLRVIEPEAVSDPQIKARLLAAIGLAHIQAQRPGEAEQTLDRALEAYPQSVPALVAHARLALGLEEVAKAADYVERALAIDPDSAAAWLARGDIARYRQQGQAAIDAYQKVIDLGLTDISPQELFVARGRLAEQLMAADRPQDAGGHIDTMLSQAPRHPYANYLGGLHAYGRQDYPTATERLQVVLSVTPENLAAQALLGAVKVQQEQYAQAISLLSEVVSRQPDDVRARLMLAAALRRSGQPEQAAEVLAQGISESADNPVALATIGQAAGEDLDSVIASLERSARTDPAARSAQLDFARTLLEQGNVGPAMTMLQQPEIAAGDEQLLRRQFLAVAALRSGDAEAALAEARAMMEDYPDNPAAYNLAGGIYMALDRLDEARAAFEQARSLDPERTQTILNMGLLAVAEGDLDAAARYLEQGLSTGAENASAMMALAQVELQRGNTERAGQWLERAVTAAPETIQPRIALTRFYFRTNQPAAALEAANEAVELSPNSPVTLGLRGMAQLAVGDAEAAVASLRSAVDQAGDSPQLRVALARAQALAGDETAARSTLQALYQERPELVRAGYSLGLLQIRAGDTQAALDTAERIQAQERGGAIGALLAGQAHSAAGDTQAAIDAYQKAVDAGLRDALGPLVAVRVKAGMETPEQPLLAWLENHPDDGAARLSLAQWYTQRNAYAQAAEQYEILAEATDRQNAALLNNLAWVYHQSADPRALETARQAHALAPENPAVADTLGWIELQSGNVDEARALLAAAVAAAPDQPEIRYHYAAALARAGETDAARKQLQTALEGNAAFSARADAEALLKSLAEG